MTQRAEPKPRIVHARGPRPFVTERHYLHQGERHIWQSRAHRRGLHHLPFAENPANWRPERLNVWIGSGFAIGAALFGLCACLVLRPALAAPFGLSETAINTGFFIGSVFFTAAAWLQLFQAANAGRLPGARAAPRHLVPLGWRPDDIGWLSCFLQFLGTLLFNVNTFMAIDPSGQWLRDELVIWTPDVIGSILFLVSGYLAFAEASHGYLSWRPASLSWWVVTSGLAGCVAFMISAVYAFVPRAGAVAEQIETSVVWTLIGAICFFASAVLLLIEASYRQP